jgi:hypothetical protein
MSIAFDGYLLKSWNVLTELDIVPPAVKREGTFLNSAMAAILAQENGDEAHAPQAEQDGFVPGNNAEANEIRNDNNAVE